MGDFIFSLEAFWGYTLANPKYVEDIFSFISFTVLGTDSVLHQRSCSDMLKAYAPTQMLLDEKEMVTSILLSCQTNVMVDAIFLESWVEAEAYGLIPKQLQQ